ncbi:MAG: methionine--tRNA ligase [Pseudomonadota bacterium]|nr:methionine--tRNA ligase [Pseudomonadota bacterium]
MNKGLCVTTALPYANGDLHLGHILEQIQADVWVRFQKMQGKHCIFVCGDDAHGTAIMLSAQQKEITPDEWVAEVWKRHRADIFDFNVGLDVFHTTRCSENKALVESLYHTLSESGSIVVKDVQQAYDETEKMFLPDRFIRGGCPKCGAADQYGDHCEQCGAHYLPTELVNPYSVLSKTTPVERVSEHVFFQLSQKETMLQQWMVKANLQSSVSNKLSEWLDSGLQNWDISRDAPYFGFLIPGYQDKYFYVWMDAPVGYMAALQKLDKDKKTDYFNLVFNANSQWDLVHFIGKDLVNFHGVFWPTVLASAGYRQPSSLHVHGFITINGEKMSKSKGTFVTARAYLDKLSCEYLRYYFACKLSDSVVDIDLNWADFVARCNSDLVGKIINIGSRSASFIHKYFQGQLADSLDDRELYAYFLSRGEKIATLYDQKKFNLVCQELIALADKANQYVDSKKPWQMVKDPENLAEVGKVCTTALHFFWILAVYLLPIVPDTSKKVFGVFQKDASRWQDASMDFCSSQLGVFPRILERLSLDMCPA